MTPTRRIRSRPVPHVIFARDRGLRVIPVTRSTGEPPRAPSLAADALAPPDECRARDSLLACRVDFPWLDRSTSWVPHSLGPMPPTGGDEFPQFVATSHVALRTSTAARPAPHRMAGAALETAVAAADGGSRPARGVP